MGDALKSWVKTAKARNEILKAKIEALLSRAKRYKSGTSSKVSSVDTTDFSITK